MAGQRFFQLSIKLGDLAQKGRLVIRQGVLDFVGHAQFRVAQHAGLPELGRAGAQQAFVFAQLAFSLQAVAGADQGSDRALGVENALALHFGRVRSQHRRDEAMLQGRRDLMRAHACLVQTFERKGQRPWLQAAGALMDVAPPHMVTVFGDIGQMREIAEGPDHHHRLLTAEAFQQLVETLACLRIVLEPERH